MPLKCRKIAQSLTAKGFREDRARKHVFYRLEVAGLITAVHTMLSHGCDEISDPLVSKMARDVRLKRPQFVALVDCTLKGPEYLALLRADGVDLT